MKFNSYICSMKKIIISLLFTFYSITILSQNKNDILDFNNINYNLLDSLVFEEAMKLRESYKLDRMKKDAVCDLAAKYQSEYMSYYNTITHKNDKSFKGVLLKTHGDRFRHFLSKSPKNNLKYDTKIEVLIQFPTINKINYVGLDSKTYEDYAKFIISSFITSEAHKHGMLYNMKEFGDMYGEYKSHYDKKTDTLYVTGLFVLVLSI